MPLVYCDELNFNDFTYHSLLFDFVFVFYFVEEMNIVLELFCICVRCLFTLPVSYSKAVNAWPHGY